MIDLDTVFGKDFLYASSLPGPRQPDSTNATSGQAEGNVIRDPEHLDIFRARNALDRDHFGLLEVKERILDFLAVRALIAQLPSEEATLSRVPLMCLVGSPDVGKTSLAQSIAEALGRRFVRVSFGGVHSEAGIRGHRRTCAGAMPGRIIAAVSSAGRESFVYA